MLIYYLASQCFILESQDKSLIPSLCLSIFKKTNWFSKISKLGFLNTIMYVVILSIIYRASFNCNYYFFWSLNCSSGKLLKLVPEFFWHDPSSFWYGMTRYSKLILYISCPRSTISQFSKSQFLFILFKCDFKATTMCMLGAHLPLGCSLFLLLSNRQR